MIEKNSTTTHQQKTVDDTFCLRRNIYIIIEEEIEKAGTPKETKSRV